jgi:ATP-dependent Lhr-like helicase
VKKDGGAEGRFGARLNLPQSRSEGRFGVRPVVLPQRKFKEWSTVGSFDLSSFHPVLSAWFAQRFDRPTEVQALAWQQICAGRHTLIAAPTGSGKTLASLMPCLHGIAEEKQRGPSGDSAPGKGVQVLYVTPLKALNNDIHHHLFDFLAELNRVAAGLGLEWAPIRAGVRTGDTAQSTRASMLRNPPDLLVTTPESLYILMTSLKGREMLRTVRRVIVDEIHDLAADKRGVHLSLTLERLVELCGRSPQRIGVSATQKPLERVARFLGGWEEREGEMTARPVEIVEAPMDKKFDLAVTMPAADITMKDRESAWTPILERIFQLIEGARTVLIFVNSRRLCERLTLRLNDYAGYEFARSHHGSVSREKRLEVERALKAGELRCLVATSSLELGIDVGQVDLVIQLDSPQSAAAGIQRIGRAGHAVGAASRGVILARSRGALPETAVLARLIAERDIEAIRVPRHCLDVLAQQIVAMVAADDWDVSALYGVVTRSDCYRGFPRERLAELLQVLSGYYPFVRPLIDWDPAGGVLKRRKNTLMTAVAGAGSIPQSSAYPVHHAESRVHLGELDEEFVHESRVGDVFQLGTSSWMIQSIRPDRIYVTEARNRMSEIPFWRGEAPGRSFELGRKIGAFVAELCRRLDGTERGAEPADDRRRTMRWLETEYRLDAPAAEQLVSLVGSQRARHAVPTDRRLVLEQFVDQDRQTHLILHNWFGRKFNRTWLMALERHFARTVPCRFYANAKDNGIEFVFPEWDPAWLQAVWQVTPDALEPLLQEAAPASPLFALAFRQLAETSLLISRGFSRVPAWRQRLRGVELLKQALPYAEHFPLFHEALRVCLTELLDVVHVREVLEQIRDGRIELIVEKNDIPSPWANQFLADYVNRQIYESDAPDQDLQLQLAGVSRELAGQLFGPEALRRTIATEVLEEERERLETDAGLTLQRADDLLVLLKRRGDMTEAEIGRLAGGNAGAWLAELAERHRIASVDIGGERRWICGDERETYDIAMNGGAPDADGGFAAAPTPAELSDGQGASACPPSGDMDSGAAGAGGLRQPAPTRAMALRLILGRHIEHRVGFTEEELRSRYPFASAHLGQLMAAWKAEKTIEPAPFADGGDERNRLDGKNRLWISSNLSARLVRLSVAHRRQKAGQPVDAARYCSHLLFTHHLFPADRLQGSDGLRKVIGRLQGLFLPCSHWESVVFPARLNGYRKEDLDALCASGEVIWIGKRDEAGKEGKVAFFLSDNRELYAPFLQQAGGTRHPELLELLRNMGASFLSALCRETGRLPSELLADLLDLVWEGHVANDQFAPLRNSLRSADSLRKAGSGLGRWYALSTLGKGEVPPEQSALAWSKHLLASIGLVTRDLVSLYAPFSWDTMFGVMKRLEEWGIATRGLFVETIENLQFSAMETLVALRQPAPSVGREVTVLSSVDPANPFGQIIPWPALKGAAFARKKGNDLVFCGGTWLFWLQNNGRAIYDMGGEAATERDAAERRQHALKEVFRILIRQRKLPKVAVDTWNGQRVANTPAAELLQQLGAERDRDSFVLWPSAIR